MSSKRAPRNFYKGKGAKSTGFLTKHGNFHKQLHKIEELVVPDLSDCDLRPYVSYRTPKLGAKND
eukprot:751347-Hanusia_phi.AAC.8